MQDFASHETHVTSILRNETMQLNSSVEECARVQSPKCRTDAVESVEYNKSKDYSVWMRPVRVAGHLNFGSALQLASSVVAFFVAITFWNHPILGVSVSRFGGEEPVLLRKVLL